MKNDYSLPQKLCAEFLGTLLLVLVGAGSIPATVLLDKLMGAPSITEADLGIISLAFAFIIAAMVYIFAEISGCHINPAVTLGFVVTKSFLWWDALWYMVAQFLGGIVGGLIIVTLFGREVALGNFSGAPLIAKSISPWQAVATEGIGTFILVFVIYGFVADRNAPKQWAGLIIGLLVAGEIFVFGPLTYCAINPARAIGPMLVQAWVGGPNLLMDNVWVYILGDYFGGILGALAYVLIFVPRPAASGGEPDRGEIQAPPAGTETAAGRPS